MMNREDHLDSRLLQVAVHKKQKSNQDLDLIRAQQEFYGIHNNNIDGNNHSNNDRDESSVYGLCSGPVQCLIFVIVLLVMLPGMIQGDTETLWAGLIVLVFLEIFIVIASQVIDHFHVCCGGSCFVLVIISTVYSVYKLFHAMINNKRITTVVTHVNTILACLSSMALVLMYIYTYNSLESRKSKVSNTLVDELEQHHESQSHCNCNCSFNNYRCNQYCGPRFHLNNYGWWYTCVKTNNKCVHSKNTVENDDHDHDDEINSDNKMSFTIMSQIDTFLSIKLILFVCQELIFCSKSIIFNVVLNKNFTFGEMQFIVTRIDGLLCVIFGLLFSRCQCCQKNCSRIVFGLCCKTVQHKHRSLMLRYWQLQLFWNFSCMMNIASINLIEYQLQTQTKTMNWQSDNYKSWEYLIDIIYCIIQMLFALRFTYQSYVLYLLILYKKLTVDESAKIEYLLQRSLKMYLCFDLRIDNNNDQLGDSNSLVEKVINNFKHDSIFANDAVYQNSSVKRQKKLQVPCFMTFQIIVLSVYIVWHCIVVGILLF